MAYIVIPTQMSEITKIIPNVDKVVNKDEHYEAQIKAITEDFHLEREARVSAHQRAEDLQEEVNRLKSHIEKQMQATAMASKQHQQCTHVIMVVSNWLKVT